MNYFIRNMLHFCDSFEAKGVIKSRGTFNEISLRIGDSDENLAKLLDYAKQIDFVYNTHYVQEVQLAYDKRATAEYKYAEEMENLYSMEHIAYD